MIKARTLSIDRQSINFISRIIILMLFTLSLVISINVTQVSAAPCVAGNSQMGSLVRNDVSVQSGGMHSVWVRAKSKSPLGNSIGAEVIPGGGGATCFNVISTNVDTWQWIKAGSISLTQNGNTIKLVGRDQGILIDRVILVNDNRTCEPSNTRNFDTSGTQEPGDNCIVDVIAQPPTQTEPTQPTAPGTPTVPPQDPTPQPENKPPTDPTNVKAKLKFNYSTWKYAYDISWNPSTDSDGSIAYYEVNRNGVLVGRTNGPATKITDNSNLEAGKDYSYSIKAVDNLKASSGEATVNVKPQCFLIWCR